VGRLTGKRVVLTGASSGIGRAAVPRFASEGASLALFGRHSGRLDEAVSDAGEAGCMARPYVVDVTDRPATHAAIAEAADWLGGIDILVLNAAAASYGTFRDTPAADFDRTVATAFGGAVDTVRAALPHLVESSGTIVANLSVLGRFPVPLFSSYVASKHALRGFLGSLRIEMEHEGTGVRVAIVHPGHVDTPFWRRVSSATGLVPRLPPLAYDAGRVAGALVDAAANPRRERTVGALARLQVIAAALSMPLADRSGRLLARWLESGNQPAREPGALWDPDA
jgi:NAD(P)-dependent dehydrogenase (short-subunit alcohol dehydrogenase family)